MKRLAACTAAVIMFAGWLLPLTAWGAEPVFPVGSRVGLIPPEGFEASTRFSGFEDAASGSSILVLDMPPQAYADVEKQMTRENMKKQGIAEEKRENLTLNSGRGVMIVGRQETDGRKIRKWILVMSATDASALIAVQIPDAAKPAHSDQAIRTALTTLTVRPTVPIDELLRLLPFTFEDLAGLRPVRVVGSTGAFLTDGPKNTVNATEQPVLIVAVGVGGPEQTQARDTFARNLFTGLTDFKSIQISGVDVIRLGGVQTHQILADATDAKTGVAMKIVQWVRFGMGGYLRIVGIARADAWTEMFPRFRVVRDGVHGRG
jgi:hypothetical protein